MLRRILPVAATLVTLAAVPNAHAAITSVLDAKVPCAPRDGVRFCEGGTAHLVPSFDGATLDVNVTLPASGNGAFPVVGIYHGWGGSKVAFDASKPWAERGYAVFTMSDRGWGDSCGGQSTTRTSDGCKTGYNHLMDTRFEVRDAQELIGRLADEGVVDGKRVGAMGGSYGGGISMALAALKDRIMLPDGKLAPWRSPKRHLPMRIAAATPTIPWTDLAYSLVPNGRTLDYVVDSPYGDRGGVMKASFVSGLFATGVAASNYAPPGTDPDADLYKWFAVDALGEPYDGNPVLLDALDEIMTHHSSYYIDHSRAPAPLLIANGWTDDLFPADEALRFYNRTRTEWPSAPISLMFFDFGHQRGQGKAADTALLAARQRAWFDHYLKGVGLTPSQGVTTLTTTCPKAAPSAGPFNAPTWKALSPGEVRFADAGQQVVASGGDPQAGRAFDPIAGGGACATASDTNVPGTAVYRLPAVAGSGYTLMGSPTIVASLTAPSPTAQVAARLLDVGPDGNETLVARGLYRPDQSTGPVRQVFQLHANGWRFAAGHVAKLELLSSDAPYARPSNGGGAVVVENLELRLPVLERPAGVVKPPAPKVVPAGRTLMKDYRG